MYPFPFFLCVSRGRCGLWGRGGQRYGYIHFFVFMDNNVCFSVSSEYIILKYVSEVMYIFGKNVWQLCLFSFL